MKRKTSIALGCATVLTFVAASWLNTDIAPQYTSQTAVMQLDDSNASYTAWKHVGTAFKLAYLVPALLFISTVYTLIKGK